MGILDKLRAELVDIVEWIDDSQHTLVWRFPRYHNQIKYGAQLIVRPGQTAIFVKQGQIADVFGPGQHRLETRNLPILSTIVGWKHGFDSPFMAEIYFVSTRQVTDLKWGTPNPVMMRDPDFGSVRVRAFGSYTLKALDPTTLLKELVGTNASFEADEIHELLRSIVPAEVEQALDTRSSMNAIGDMAAFQAYQLGQAMPVAAANPAGGLAGAGVGLGMGAAIAGPMLRNSDGGAAPHAPQSPPPPPPSATLWHVAQGGQSFGPYTEAQIAQAISEGRVQRDTSIWTAGMAGWAAAASVDALARLFGTPPPPPAAD
jgi:membrane protease subunit (stomatin/prohibitin family)